MNTKKRPGVVSYIGIGILTLIVISTIVLLIYDFISVGGKHSDYEMFGPLLIFLIAIPNFVYYAITTIISIVMDLTKGKSTGKDITISILYGLPVLITLGFIVFVALLGMK